MKFNLVRTEPCQVLAAEENTLDALTAALIARFGEPRPEAHVSVMAQLTGIPLVVDPEVPPGEVRFRPFARA